MSAEESLDDLAKKLRAVKLRGLATQVQLAANTGIDQGAISRALNGYSKRMTEGLVRLEKYVDMLLGDGEISSGVQEASRKFLVAGGTEAELIATIEHSAKLVRGELK